MKMKNLENGTEFIWPKEKFLNRLYLMKEMYNNYEEEEEDWDLPEDKDPFQEDVNTEVSKYFEGVAVISLFTRRGGKHCALAQICSQLECLLVMHVTISFSRSLAQKSPFDKPKRQIPLQIMDILILLGPKKCYL